jgi:hypothetical protein
MFSTSLYVGTTTTTRTALHSMTWVDRPPADLVLVG